MLSYKKNIYSLVNKISPTKTVLVSNSQKSDSAKAFDINYHVFRVKFNKLLPTTKFKGQIVFFGDSIIETFVGDLSRRYSDGMAGKLSTSFQKLKIVNYGISSDTTLGLLDRINDVTALKPSKIFIMVGINDLSMGRSIDIISNNYEKIILKLQKNSPSSKIFIQSILPVNEEIHNTVKNKDIILLNQKLKLLSNYYHVTYIDLHPIMLDSKGQLNKLWTWDGVHIYMEGFNLWRKEIEKFI